MPNIRLKDSVYQKIKKEAEKMDLSIATIITLAIDEYLRNKYKEVDESSAQNNT